MSPTSSHLPAGARPVLIVAHPGHELRVFGWMSGAQPVTCVLTDGSGSDGQSRLASTTRLLDMTGARAGRVYGRMSDRAIYQAMLAGDTTRFLGLADEIAEVLVSERADYVVGDAAEGFNPSHDLCRLLINAAVRLANVSAAPHVFDFALDSAPDTCNPALRERAVWIELDDATLQRKLEAARGYAELAGEVSQALERFGTAPFKVECLRPVDVADRYGWDQDRVPYYETYGERRVEAGAYDRVVRYREHLKPLADALWTHSVIRA